MAVFQVTIVSAILYNGRMKEQRKKDDLISHHLQSVMNEVSF